MDNITIMDVTRKQIGFFLKSRREELGLSTRGLAELANTTHSQIVKFENGKANITINTLLSLCVCLRVKLSFEIIG